MGNYFDAQNTAFTDASPASRIIDSVAVLCQATQGTIPLGHALRRLAKVFGAEAVALCRVDMRVPHHSAKVVSHETNRHMAEDAGQMEISFARGICGADFQYAKVGSVWFGTEETLGGETRLTSVYRNRRLVESAIVFLDKRNGMGDFLELHFAHAVSAEFETHLESLSPVLADCWKARGLGRFSDALLGRGRPTSEQPANQAILSMNNPCRLSRAEYRVCLLLGRGLNNQAVLSELSITMATLRTHLRNIYAKTGTGSQPELIHLLLSPAATLGLRQSGAIDVA